MDIKPDFINKQTVFEDILIKSAKHACPSIEYEVN